MEHSIDWWFQYNDLRSIYCQSECDVGVEASLTNQASTTMNFRHFWPTHTQTLHDPPIELSVYVIISCFSAVWNNCTWLTHPQWLHKTPKLFLEFFCCGQNADVNGWGVIWKWLFHINLRYSSVFKCSNIVPLYLQRNNIYISNLWKISAIMY